MSLKGAWVQCFPPYKKLTGDLTGSLQVQVCLPGALTGYGSRTSGHESLVTPLSEILGPISCLCENCMSFSNFNCLLSFALVASLPSPDPHPPSPEDLLNLAVLSVFFFFSKKCMKKAQKPEI